MTCAVLLSGVVLLVGSGVLLGAVGRGCCALLGLGICQASKQRLSVRLKLKKDRAELLIEVHKLGRQIHNEGMIELPTSMVNI